MYNEVAVTVLGTIGTVLWCVQLIPQIVRNFIVKDCTGVPAMMMFLWTASGIPFGIYFFGTDGSVPLRVQPQLFTFFCLITWAQTLYYPPLKVSVIKMVALVGTFVLVAVGLEVGFILWLRPIYRDGKHWPMLVIGIIASVLLAVGLIPPYFELAKRQGRVVGINFFFLGMDSMGALFSLVSIIVGSMDRMSMALYAIVLALELGIFTSQILWYITIGRSILKREKEEKEKNNTDADELDKNGPENLFSLILIKRIKMRLEKSKLPDGEERVTTKPDDEQSTTES
ncbi:uncharacterized protein PRCAT00002762001 [Priceomyces carsonii]|uniref:uncharacterized protein n=1 Tax=Priceomyces carsonii TaxID=28549 RepID=UPI002ED9FE1D|nr:unnamed protein product [Priceomyces carsonii]